MDPFYVAAGLAALACFALLTLLARPRRSRSNRPPGPPLPANHGGAGHRSLISGPKVRLTVLSTQRGAQLTPLAAQPWLKFKEWHDRYGDLIYLEIGSQPTYICGSVQVAWDLLEKRSNIYSSRPRFIVAGEVLSDGKRGSLAPYGPYWRNWRYVQSRCRCPMMLSESQESSSCGLYEQASGRVRLTFDICRHR